MKYWGRREEGVMMFDAEHEVATPSVKKGSYPFRRKQKNLKVKRETKKRETRNPISKKRYR
jgi:hypothetical protein